MDSAAPSRPAARTAALVLAGLAVAHAGPGVTALGPVRRRFFPRLSGLGRADHVAVTFDDGPDPAWTPAFLEVLAAARVRATFFMLGTMAARAPGLAAEVAGAGHEVAVHGWAHRYTILRSPRAVADDLARATDAVAERDRRAAALLPAALRCAEFRRARRRTPARAHPGAVDLLGPGMDGGRHAPVGRHDAHQHPGRRRHGPAARLRLHLAAWFRRGGAGRPAPVARRMCATPARGRPGRRARTGSLIRGKGTPSACESVESCDRPGDLWKHKARPVRGAPAPTGTPQYAFSLRSGR